MGEIYLIMPSLLKFFCDTRYNKTSLKTICNITWKIDRQVNKRYNGHIRLATLCVSWLQIIASSSHCNHCSCSLPELCVRVSAVLDYPMTLFCLLINTYLTTLGQSTEEKEGCRKCCRGEEMMSHHRESEIGNKNQEVVNQEMVLPSSI